MFLIIPPQFCRALRQAVPLARRLSVAATLLALPYVATAQTPAPPPKTNGQAYREQLKRARAQDATQKKGVVPLPDTAHVGEREQAVRNFMEKLWKNSTVPSSRIDVLNRFRKPIHAKNGKYLGARATLRVNANGYDIKSPHECMQEAVAM
jgi:hypothetical protein